MTSGVFSFLLSMRDVKPPPSALRSSQPRRWLRVALLVACCAAVAAPAPPPPAATAFSSLAPAYVTTLAGNGSTAIFSNPRSGSFGPDGCLYVADQGNNVIRKVSAAGVVTLVAGIVSSSAPAATSASGPPLSTALRTPYSTALDAAGNLYIAEYGGCMIKLLNATSNVLSLFAGVASSCSSTDGPVGTATFASPTGVYVDASGIVWVSETYAVRKILGGQVTTLAGNKTVSGACVRHSTMSRSAFSRAVVSWFPISRFYFFITGFHNAVGTSALFNGVRSVAMDTSGNLIVSEAGNNAVRRGDTH